VRLRPLELRLRHFAVLLDLLVLLSSVDVFQFVPRLLTGPGYSELVFTRPSPWR
jgi:hypothetical protein